jgi:hypothetical protein
LLVLIKVGIKCTYRALEIAKVIFEGLDPDASESVLAALLQHECWQQVPPSQVWAMSKICLAEVCTLERETAVRLAKEMVPSTLLDFSNYRRFCPVASEQCPEDIESSSLCRYNVTAHCFMLGEIFYDFCVLFHTTMVRPSLKIFRAMLTVS